jgi:hypothetical protein
MKRRQPTSERASEGCKEASVSIRQHTYVSIRLHAPLCVRGASEGCKEGMEEGWREGTEVAYVSIRQHPSAYMKRRQRASERASGDARKHTSAYVSIHQHTSAYVCMLLCVSEEQARDARKEWRREFFFFSAATRKNLKLVRVRSVLASGVVLYVCLRMLRMLTDADGC